MIHVVSFYTQDDYYAPAATRLADECDRLGLPYHIVERKYEGSWIDTLRIKPAVILEALEVLKEPVLWIDVDGSIYHRPDACDPMRFDYQGVPKKPQQGRPFYMGCQFFNNTESAKFLLRQWSEEYAKDDSEEMCFGRAIETTKRERPDFRCGELPPTYMEIATARYRRSPHTVVVHRLSPSESKKEFYRSRA